VADLSAQALEIAAARVSVSEFTDRQGGRWHFVDLCHRGALLRRIPCRTGEEADAAHRTLIGEIAPWIEVGLAAGTPARKAAPCPT
jgi:hypothetical protein